MTHPRRLVVCAAVLAALLAAANAQDKDKDKKEEKDVSTEVDKAHDALIYSLAVSPDGKMLASGSYDKTIKLWELPSMKFIKKLEGHTENVYCVTFNKDGTELASSAQDKTIRIWNVKDGKTVREMKGHTDIVDSIAYSPDNKYLASGSADKSVRLWNPADGKEAKKLGDHPGSVFAVAFSPDGKVLASGGSGGAGKSEGVIKIWDVANMKETKQLKGHTEAVTGLVFKSNTEVISISQDKTVRLWDVTDGKEIKRFDETKDDLYGLALSKDGKTLATSGYGGWVNVWNVDVKKEEETPAAAKTRKLLATKTSVELKGAKFDEVVKGITKGVKDLSIKYDAKAVPTDKTFTYAAKDKLLEDVLADVCKEGADLGYYVVSKKGDADDGAIMIRRSDERGTEKKPAPPTFSKKLKIFGAYCVVFTPDGKSLITGHEKPAKDNVKLLITPIGK